MWLIHFKWACCYVSRKHIFEVVISWIYEIVFICVLRHIDPYMSFEGKSSLYIHIEYTYYLWTNKLKVKLFLNEPESIYLHTVK